ncbi:MAG: hypothetical protein J5892_03430 [Bacilli bacterium]|nr:hypothetical protein [Bacilli bacterium]
MENVKKVKKAIDNYIDLVYPYVSNNVISDYDAEAQKKFAIKMNNAYIERNSLNSISPDYYEKTIEKYEKYKDEFEEYIYSPEFAEYMKNRSAKLEDDFDLEEVEETEEVSPDSELEEQVNDQRKNIKKKPLKALVTGMLLTTALLIGVGIGSCANSKCKNDDNEETKEETTDEANENTTTIGDVIVDNNTTKVTVPETTPADNNKSYLDENEEDINELIDKAVDEFDAGELNITKEEYEYILDYYNNNLNVEISVDDVVNSAINPIIGAEANKNMLIINKTLGFDDTGIETGNYKTSNILLRDIETKKKIEELEILEEAMKSDDPQVRKDAAAMLYRIEWEINYQVISSHDDLYINGEAFNGYENIDDVFTKDYSAEFYQSDSAASNVLYLTKLLSLNPFAHAILGDDFKISEKITLIDEDGEHEIEHSKTIEEIEYDLNVRNCDEDDLTLLAKYVDMSVKESNNSLDYEGAYILSND